MIATVPFHMLENYVALVIALAAMAVLIWLMWPNSNDVFGSSEEEEDYETDEDFFEDLEVIFRELRSKLFCDLSPLKLISFEEDDNSLQFSSSENLSEVLNFVETGLKSIGYENTHTLNLSTGCVTFKLRRLSQLELTLHQSKETKGVFTLTTPVSE